MDLKAGILFLPALAVPRMASWLWPLSKEGPPPCPPPPLAPWHGTQAARSISPPCPAIAALAVGEHSATGMYHHVLLAPVLKRRRRGVDPGIGHEFPQRGTGL